jgi:hypothetical protein
MSCNREVLCGGIIEDSFGRNCSMAQIMAVTGHKTASSVAVYQRVSSKEKQVM